MFYLLIGTNVTCQEAPKSTFSRISPKHKIIEGPWSVHQKLSHQILLKNHFLWTYTVSLGCDIFSIVTANTKHKAVSSWHYCICCNPGKWRVDFEDGWLIKSSFITKDEMKSLSANQDQNPTKNMRQWAVKIIFCKVFASF